jgi:uncharacterized protein YdaU (DUF1376 family)
MSEQRRKAPAMQFYAADFLVDTMSWTDEEVGCHMRLLAWSWVNRRGLPVEQPRLQQISTAVARCWETVGRKWVIGPDGTYVNEKLERTRRDSDKYFENQRDKAAKSVEARRRKKGEKQSTTVTTPVTTRVVTNKEGEGEGEERRVRVEEVKKGVQGKEAKRETREDVTNAQQPGFRGAGDDELPLAVPEEGLGGDSPAEVESELWPTFEDWWELYDKKEDRKKCEAKWVKLKYATKLAIMEHTRVYVSAGRGVEYQYRRNPMTYLNGENWNDEGLLIGKGHGQPTSQSTGQGRFDAAFGRATSAQQQAGQIPDME